MDSLTQQVNAILERSKPKINGVMEGDLTPEEYIEKSNNVPGMLGYTMSVLRTTPLVKEWYYSERDRYDNHVLIDSLVKGLDSILESEHSIQQNMIYPFFERAYKKYLETPERDTRHLLGYLYLFS